MISSRLVGVGEAAMRCWGVWVRILVGVTAACIDWLGGSVLKNESLIVVFIGRMADDAPKSMGEWKWIDA